MTGRPSGSGHVTRCTHTMPAAGALRCGQPELLTRVEGKGRGDSLVPELPSRRLCPVRSCGAERGRGGRSAGRGAGGAVASLVGAETRRGQLRDSYSGTVPRPCSSRSPRCGLGALAGGAILERPAGRSARERAGGKPAQAATGSREAPGQRRDLRRPGGENVGEGGPRSRRGSGSGSGEVAPKAPGRGLGLPYRDSTGPVWTGI